MPHFCATARRTARTDLPAGKTQLNHGWTPMNTDGKRVKQMISRLENNPPLAVLNLPAKNPFSPLIRVDPCPYVASLAKAIVFKSLLVGWTATVSETASKAASHRTIHQYLSELAETLPQRAFTNTVAWFGNLQCPQIPPLEALPLDSITQHRKRVNSTNHGRR